MPKPLKHVSGGDDTAVIPGATVRLLGNNIGRWTNPQNGAQILGKFQGEENVCRFEYDPANSDDHAICDFEIKRDVGPTASGNCSISRLNCETGPTIAQYEFLESDSALTNPAVTATRFNSNGHNTADGTSKPADFHILMGVWFDYDAENPVDIGGTDRSGVFQAGIGAGDVIIMDDLVNGGGWWQFTKFNEFQNYSAGSPLPRSTTFCDAFNRHGMWFVLSGTYKPRLRVKVVPPGFAAGNNDATFYAPPDGLRYYIHAQAISGCTGLIPGIVNVAAPVAVGTEPRVNRATKGGRSES